MKQSHPVRQRLLRCSRMIADNREAVRRQNYTVLVRVLVLSLGVLSLDVGLELGRGVRSGLLAVYVLLLALAAVLTAACIAGPLKRRPLAGLYLEAAAWLSAAVYMSVIHTPTQKATVLLGLLCCLPMLITDRPWRADLLVLAILAAHTALAAVYKPAEIYIVDVINTLGFALMGIYIGNSGVYSHLQEIDLHRRAELEKRLDVLTGVRNRRRLYEELAELEAGSAELPAGALMLDIDQFKEFNDHYGHAAGDECLRRLGALLCEMEADSRLQFYRYGGDEFAAFAYGCDAGRLLQLAETLQTRAGRLIVSGQRVSVSVGAACASGPVRNYEKLIACADRQLYAAKMRGRNQVCIAGYAEDGPAA